MASKFIFNPHSGVPTIMAANRAKRPDQTGVVAKKKEEVSSIAGEAKKEKVDFFAKGNEHMTPPTLYQDQDDWNVRAFKNKFPLIDDHEVIVHSPDPIKDLEEFSCAQVERVIKAYLNRTDYYGSQGKEVIIFNNRGGKAGASLSHPHSQIVAAQGFPGIVEKEKREALKYFNAHNHCMWCDELKKVLKQKERVVYESTHFVAFVPKACRWSYEMRIIPKNHKPNFGFIDEEEIQDLAMVLKAVLSAYDALFDRPDRNFWIHTVRYEPYHWHIGLMAHLKVLGALELGAGIWVSSKATPADAASQLREFVVPVCESAQVPRGHTLKE
jgi:UDPglucose--hexose-1-phosphate uridylyltransferase